MKALCLKVLEVHFPITLFRVLSQAFLHPLIANYYLGLMGNTESCLESHVYRAQHLVEEIGHNSFCHERESTKSMENVQVEVKGAHRREKILPMSPQAQGKGNSFLH